MWGCVWLPGKLFSPIDGMKNFITFSKLLAISSAHHSVTGFMLPKHLLHCICYFSNGASKIQKQSINAIRRLVWKQNIEVTGRGPTICLAAGQIQLHFSPLVLQLWTSDSPQSSTNKTCRSVFKKILFCWCEKRFYKWQGNRDHCMAKYFRKLNQIFSTGNFFGLRLQDLAFGLILKFKI